MNALTLSEREQVREWIASQGSWMPPVLKDAGDALTAAIQRLADLGLRPAEVEQWVSESQMDVEWPVA